MLIWSEIAKQKMIKAYPELMGRLKVVGAVSFDRYLMDNKIFKLKQKVKAIHEKRTVVGIAGFGFDYSCLGKIKTLIT